MKYLIEFNGYEIVATAVLHHINKLRKIVFCKVTNLDDKLCECEMPVWTLDDLEHCARCYGKLPE